MMAATDPQESRGRARRPLSFRRDRSLPHLDAEPTEMPCMVSGCPRHIQEAGLMCTACWERLPSGARHTLTTIQTRTPAQRSRQLDVIGAALSRLAAEFGGPLSAAELEEADRLNAQYHGGYETFAELLDAAGNYFPKLYQNDRADLLPSDRMGMSRLADLYDRAQASRGDARRAVRLGHSGL